MRNFTFLYPHKYLNDSLPPPPQGRGTTNTLLDHTLRLAMATQQWALEGWIQSKRTDLSCKLEKKCHSPRRQQLLMVVAEKLGRKVGSICTSSTFEVKTEKAFTQKNPAEWRNDLSIIRMIGQWGISPRVSRVSRIVKRDSSLMVIDNS